MLNGNLEQIDTPNSLYNKPRTPFAASFVGVTIRIPAIAQSKDEVLVLNHILDISSHAPSLKKGTEVTALVRPESISMEKSAKGSAIITKSFLGAMTRIGVDVGLPELIYAEMSSREARKFDTGDKVELTISSDSVMVSNV